MPQMAQQAQTETQTPSKAPISIALKFAATVLRPLVRTFIRLGVSAEQIAELTRWLFVDEFYKTQSLWTKGRPIASRAALLTGLTRREVQRLRLIDTPPEAVTTEQQNRAARVLNGWLLDKRFHDENGKPAPLPMEGEGIQTFRRLVSLYSGDVTPITVLNELVRAKCASRIDDVVHMKDPVYGPKVLPEDAVNIAAANIASLNNTTDYNLDHWDDADKRLQRYWYQQFVPCDAVPEAKVIIRDAMIRAGREVDAELAKLAHSKPKPGYTYRRLGLGAYYFEE